VKKLPEGGGERENRSARSKDFSKRATSEGARGGHITCKKKRECCIEMGILGSYPKVREKWLQKARSKQSGGRFSKAFAQRPCLGRWGGHGFKAKEKNEQSGGEGGDPRSSIAGKKEGKKKIFGRRNVMVENKRNCHGLKKERGHAQWREKKGSRGLAKKRRRGKVWLSEGGEKKNNGG